MRFTSILLCFLLFISFKASSAEHRVSSQINYHSAQDAGFGYGIIYQYKFLENFELEAKYAESGDIKIVEHEQNTRGDYSSFSSGINFIRPYHKNLSIKLGFGANLITSSTNNLLVEENALAPYFKIVVNYKVTDSLALTLGHSSQFNQQRLATHHAFFLSVNWLFSQQPYTTVIVSKPEKQSDSIAKIALEGPKVSIPKTLVQSPIVNQKHFIEVLPSWYVQLGAFQRQENAEHKRLLLQTAHSLSLTVHLHNKLYRILSQSFPDKNSAEVYLSYLQEHYNLPGFINKI